MSCFEAFQADVSVLAVEEECLVDVFYVCHGAVAMVFIFVLACCEYLLYIVFLFSGDPVHAFFYGSGENVL